MPRYIAFLRAINVGGHTVRMEHLRALFETAGCANVVTFIASGNVIFESANADAQALERHIERCLKESLGYDVDTFLRTPAEVAAIARHQPFPAAAHAAPAHALYVAFLSQPAGALASRKLASFRTDIDDFAVHGREVYWLCRSTKLSESTFSGALLERTLATRATLRNITTVARIAAKHCAGD